MRDWLRHLPLAALFTLLTLCAPLVLEWAAPAPQPDLLLRAAPVPFSAPRAVEPPAKPYSAPAERPLDSPPDFTPPAAPRSPVAARLDAPGPPVLAFSAPGLVSADFPAASPSLAAGPVVFELAQVDKPPRALAQAEPLYPSAAALRRIQGVVVVEFEVGVDGRVDQARVVSADPAGWFEEAAVNAVHQWRFAPAESNGRPVRVRARQKVTFRL